MARRKTKNNISNKSIAAVVAIVLISTLVLFWNPTPETVSAVSDDTKIQAQGLTRSDSDLVIDRFDNVDVTLSSVMSPVYQLSLEDGGRLLDGLLTMEFLDGEIEDSDLTEIVLYVFDPATLSWQPLVTSFDLSTNEIFSTVEFSGWVMVVAAERL
jgi:hypothetical protein